jgi:hypothetical protein
MPSNGWPLASRGQSQITRPPESDPSRTVDVVLGAGLTLDCVQAYIDICMRRLAVFIPDDLRAGLSALKAEHGTPEAESIRRAIAAYLAKMGVKLTPKGRLKKPHERKRTAAVLVARRRS